MNRKVLVVDLDGTLYQCNTFHEFLKLLLSLYVKDFKILKLSFLIILMKLRCLRIISHARLKYQVLKLINNDEIDFEAFVSKLSKYKNEIEEVSDKTFDIKILATAAPSCYAEFIAKKHKFDYCLGTAFPEGDFQQDFENLGERKKEGLLRLLKENHLETIDVFVTDHLDDKSIIKIAKKNIIINPNVKLLNWLQAHLINFEVRKMN